MLFPSSRPYRIPPSTADSQYDTTGYSSSSYSNWPRSTAKSDFYVVRNADSTINSSSRQYQSNRRRNNHINEPFLDIFNYQYSRPQLQQQQPNYSANSSQRPIINYLLP